ncbi:hypothetical protein DTO212C5_5312 [Paecilomyces variotii]|nr:hypothetical protein DTO212C5_5312 [Paecilomyces variotii]
MENTNDLPAIPMFANTKQYRDAIVAHFNAGTIPRETMEKLFEELDKLPPPPTPLQQRIQDIETILQTPGALKIPGQRENGVAVLNAYKSGALQFIPGNYYIFKNGQLIAGPKPMTRSMINDIVTEHSALRDLWIEECHAAPRYMLPAFRGTLYPTGEHHMYYVSIAPLGGAQCHRFEFLHDTGASAPSLSYRDVAVLGVDATYQHWGLPEIYRTANGVILKDTIFLQASVGFPPISGFDLFKFAVSNDQIRLGGPILQSLMYQGSIPDIERRLAISCSRTGLQDELREHAH